MTTKLQRRFNTTLESLSASQEGWFDGKDSNGLRKSTSRLVGILKADKIQFHPFSAETIKEMESKMGLKLDDATRECFEHVGKIFMDTRNKELNGLSPAEIIQAHEKVKKYFPHMSKFVPWFYSYEDEGGYVGIRVDTGHIYGVYIDSSDNDGSDVVDRGKRDLCDFFHQSILDQLY